MQTDLVKKFTKKKVTAHPVSSQPCVTKGQRNVGEESVLGSMASHGIA